jgi:anti-sigma factor RsiW
VNCHEFQNRITAAVDHRLDAAELALFLEHANLCPPCNRSFENERSIAALVRTRIHRLTTPAHICQRILDHLTEEEPGSRARLLLGSAWRAPLTKPALVFTFSFAAVVFILSRSAPVPPVSGSAERPVTNMISQSTLNYRSVMKGEIRPQIASGLYEQVRSYFDGKTDFPVLVPVLKECTLIGGAINADGGTPIVHVMYRHGEHTIYLCQACYETVMAGAVLNLSREVREELGRTGWYRGMTPEGVAIVLWVKGNTLCAAVSAMPADHLMAHLVDADQTTAW